MLNTADWLGRSLVLFCCPRAFKPGCTREAQEFSSHLPLFEVRGGRDVGVSRGSPVKLTRFAISREVTDSLISDDGGALATASDAWVEKSLYGDTSMGIGRATFLFDASGERMTNWR